MIAGNNAGYSTTRSMANGIQNPRQVLKKYPFKKYIYSSLNIPCMMFMKAYQKKNIFHWKITIKVHLKFHRVLLHKTQILFMFGSKQQRKSSIQCLMLLLLLLLFFAKKNSCWRKRKKNMKTTPERIFRAMAQSQGVKNEAKFLLIVRLAIQIINTRLSVLCRRCFANDRGNISRLFFN